MDSASWLRDASRPYIRPITRIVLAVLLAILLVLTWVNASDRDLSFSLSRAGALGACLGVAVAVSDLAVGIADGRVVVRNAIFVSRVPFGAVERIDTRLGVYLKLRGRRLAVRVPVSSGFLRSKSERPRLVAEELQRLVDASPGEGGEAGDRVQVRLKATWLVAVPGAVGLFIAVDLLSRAVG